MGSKRFTILVILQILLMSITIFLFWWAIGEEHLVVAKFLFAVFWLIEAIVLIFYINKVNHSLAIFLDSLRASDFMKKLDESKGFDKLSFSYKQISEIVRKARMENERSLAFLHYTLEYMPVGVISVDDKGNVELLNSQAQNIFKISHLESMSQLNNFIEKFDDQVAAMKSGESNVFEFTSEDVRKRLLVKVFDFKLKEKKVRLLTIQNIKQELDVEELNAWHKLIRVMTHEIMNSVGPIKSLSNTLLKIANKFEASIPLASKEKELLNDMMSGLKSIRDRSDGLYVFVKSFKEFSRVPVPQKQLFDLKEELKSIKLMYNDLLTENSIKFSFICKPSDLHLYADKNQFYQIITNLLNNSIHALQERPERQISIKACLFENSRIEIHFEDNGKGIPEENFDKIFVPFFTTRQGGSGIGLSLVKQIMHLHGGSVEVHSCIGKTAFKLMFYKGEFSYLS